MKTMRNLFMILLVAVLCVACSQTADYVNVIPKDAPVVAAVNLQALGEKASLKDYKGFIDMGLMQVQKSDAQLYEQLKAVVEDPSSLGLALNEPLYFFMLADGKNAAGVMKVTDGDKVKQLAQKFLSQEGIEYSEEGDRMWIAASVAIVVTNDLLLVGPDRVMLEKLLAQTADDSFVSTGLWDDMAAMKGDIKLSVAQGKLVQADEMMQMPELEAFYQALGVDLKESKSVMGIDFLPGKAVVFSKAYNSEEFGEMQEKLLDKVDGDFLTKMPANPALWMTMNMDGKALAELAERILEAIPDAKQVDMEEIRPFIETINGEVAFALNGVQSGGQTMLPDLTVFARVKDNVWEEKLRSLGGNPAGLAYGMAGDDLFYLTTNKEVMANPGERLDASVADASWADKVDGSYCYMTVEAEPLKQLLGMTLSRSEKRQAEAILNLFERAEAGNTSLDEGEITVYFKNKEENALKQLIQLAISMNM